MVAGRLYTPFDTCFVLTFGQDNCHAYPTLARIAIDVLACQGSSVPCERLFSGSKLIADDHRSRLGAARFEELQVMKFAWRRNIADLAAWNSMDVEEVELEVYKDLIISDQLENVSLDEGDDYNNSNNEN